MRCETCCHFHPECVEVVPSTSPESRPETIGFGECRINPPVRVDNDPLAKFPMVNVTFWCGKYRPA